MTFELVFYIEGVPIAKGRPKFARRGKFVTTYTPKKTKAYEEDVKTAALEYLERNFKIFNILRTPISVTIDIALGVPKSYSKKRREACLSGEERPLKKPDIDNVAKCITDALNGVLYIDDCQIVRLSITKRYDVVPHAVVLIKEVLK